MQQPQWSNPPCGYLKINFDATWNRNKAGMGFITRDTEGFVHEGGVCFSCIKRLVQVGLKLSSFFAASIGLKEPSNFLG